MASGAIIIRHFVINSWPHQFTSQNDAIWIGIWLGAFIKVVTSTIPVMPIQKPFQPLFVYSPQCKEESPNSISNLRKFFSASLDRMWALASIRFCQFGVERFTITLKNTYSYVFKNSELLSVLKYFNMLVHQNNVLWILRCFKYFHIQLH